MLFLLGLGDDFDDIVFYEGFSVWLEQGNDALGNDAFGFVVIFGFGGFDGDSDIDFGIVIKGYAFESIFEGVIFGSVEGQGVDELHGEIVSAEGVEFFEKSCDARCEEGVGGREFVEFLGVVEGDGDGFFEVFDEFFGAWREGKDFLLREVDAKRGYV